MKITRNILATLLVVVMADVSQAQLGVSGSRVREEFNYAEGPLNGLSGADERNLLGTWSSTGDAATPGEPFSVNGVNLNFGPQVTLFDNPALGSIRRSPQSGTGGATRLIGKEPGNFNIQNNIIKNDRESFTQLKMIWNGGKLGFALSNREFNLSNGAIKLLADPAGTPETPVGESFAGFGFTVEADAVDPDIGILKSTVFRTFGNGSAGNTLDSGAGIQLVKGDTYQVFIQGEVSNDAVFGDPLDLQDDQISVYVLSEADIANPEATVYLADLPATSKSIVAQSFGNSSLKEELQFATYATQNFKVDDLHIGFLSGTEEANLNNDVLRDPARQALVAFRTEHQKIAWKSSLGDPYVAGDTRLDGVLLGSASNAATVTSNDISHLQGQIRLGNTSTVAYYDLDGSGVIDDADVEFLVETLYGSTIADFDLDFDVDADDLAAWTAGYGIGGVWEQGDANGSGEIDGADFLSWQRNFTGAPAVGASSSVPEPSSVALVLLACASLAAVRRRVL